VPFIEEVVYRGCLDVVDQFWADDTTWRGGSPGELRLQRRLVASRGAQ